MMWWWTSAALAVTPPSVQLSWNRGDARIVVVPPAGHGLAEDAPADVTVRWGEREVHAALSGADITEGLALGEVRGAALEGQLAVVLCDKASGLCEPSTWALAVQVPAEKKGTIEVAVADDSHTEAAHASPFGPEATTADADAALARAGESGKLVLLDFSAVWCPPCMALAAEVLHADPPPAELEAYEIAVVDVDHTSSWTFKDRYAIGGYPTLVMVDAAGNEKSRVVGYPGREAFLAWLAAGGADPDAADLARTPDDVEPARAAALAWKLAQQGEQEAAQPWLKRAEGAPESVELHLARAAAAATPEDLEWLLENAPDRAEDWVFSAIGLAKDHPELAGRVATLALQKADGDDLGDALYLAAKVEQDEARARTLFAAAAAAVRGNMGEDELLDKASLDWLARLTEMGGDAEGGLEVLREASERWAPEPTYDLAMAGMLNRLGRHEEAVVAADRALEHAWGDNRLRCASAKAEALDALGRPEEAAAVATRVLEEVPAPDEELDVRTGNYRERLAKWLKND